MDTPLPELRTPSKRCPNCGAPPAVRVHRLLTVVTVGPDPDDVVMSVQCSVGWCQTVYEIMASDIALAG